MRAGMGGDGRAAAAGIEIRRLAPEELDVGSGVVGRAFRDNPTSLVIYGAAASHRERCQQRFFSAVLRFQREAPLAALRNGRLVGISGFDPPGACYPTVQEQLRHAPRMLMSGWPHELWRGMRYFQTLHRHDLSEAHWHLGPVAVEPTLQGTGVGSCLMEAFCAFVDERSGISYLETEKPENVRFYERFGFETINRVEFMSVPQWLMRRPPAGRG